MLLAFGLVMWFALQRVAYGAGENQAMILAKTETTDGLSKSTAASLDPFSFSTPQPMTSPLQNVGTSTSVYSSEHLKRVLYLWMASKAWVTYTATEDFR
jgi:hypothetical protein